MDNQKNKARYEQSIRTMAAKKCFKKIIEEIMEITDLAREEIEKTKIKNFVKSLIHFV